MAAKFVRLNSYFKHSLSELYYSILRLNSYKIYSLSEI